MCGIAGVFGRSQPSLVETMLGRLRHRGPDDQFLVSGPRFTLGAARLAILDVDGGRQPLSNEQGNVWAAQNGEIYNFPELRKELLSRGHALHTRTDTELLPHLLEEHGQDFPRQLRGMFAVALWDDRAGRGFLARDPLGKKPLYYLEDRGALYFASEIKSLLAVPDYARRVDPAAIHHFLSFKHVPSPGTVFLGIRSLGPGQILSFEAGQSPRIETYWRLSWATDPAWERADETEVAQELLAALREAVRRRLLSDVPIGFYLSGGLDSSLSTALAATLSSQPIKTFTLTYDEPSTTPGKEEDRRFARRVSEQYGTEHHEERLSALDFAQELPRILRHFDQPFSGVVSSYFLARLIARHVKVALSGDGADELFGSYLSHRLAPAIDAYLERGGNAFESPWARENQALVERIAHSDPAAWRARLFVFDDGEKSELYTGEFAAALRDVSSAEELRKDFACGTATDSLNRVLEAELKRIFPDQVLAFVDRLSMAHSLETRTAFLDVDFVALAASLPGRLKIRDGECKYILKRAAERLLPRELVFRKKEGFVLPVNQWLRASLGGFARDVLSPDAIARAGVFRPQAVASLLDRFGAGEETLANKVLSLLTLQLWWNDYLGASRAY